jgi:nitrilase
MRASVIQIEAGADKRANIAAAASLIEASVSADRPDLVSLPEMWSCLGGDRATKLAAGETLPPPGAPETEHAAPRPAYDFLRDTARRHGVTVHGGSIGERVGDRLFNTSLIFAPDGREIARYRKIHLFDVTTPNGQGYRESAMFGAGDAVVTCEAAGVTCGLAICYDLRFPELFLALRRAGSVLIFLPAAFTAETGRDHWEVLLRARAIETQCWIVAAATTGLHADARGQARETYGHAMIVSPWGHVVGQLDSAPGHLTADIDQAVTARVRAAMPVLEHRRLDLMARAERAA